MAKHILLVDDDPGVLQISKIMLERGGYNVLTADGGREALEILTTVAPEIVIVDVMMPEMNGIELCQHIRRIPALKTTPILMLSARNETEIIQQSLHAGANDFIVKPILRNDLLAKVNELLTNILI